METGPVASTAYYRCDPFDINLHPETLPCNETGNSIRANYLMIESVTAPFTSVSHLIQHNTQEQTRISEESQMKKIFGSCCISRYRLTHAQTYHLGSRKSGTHQVLPTNVV